MSEEDQVFSWRDEQEIIKDICEKLEPLSVEGRSRVMDYIIRALEIDTVEGSPMGSEASYKKVEETSNKLDQFTTLADLYHRAAPTTVSDSALVAAYWVQEQSDQNNFVSQDVNKELKHLGKGAKNITSALKHMMDLDPALVMQVRKSGKSQQARKIYKITDAGMRRVREMISE